MADTDSDSDGFGRRSSSSTAAKPAAAISSTRSGLFTPKATDILDRHLQHATHLLTSVPHPFIHETFSWGNLVGANLSSPLDIKVDDRMIFVRPLETVPAQTAMRISQGTLFASAVRRIKKIPWPEQQSGKRHRALLSWRTILEENLAATTLGKQIHDMALGNSSDKDISEAIADSFAQKSISTLVKRSASILKFLIWHRKVTGMAGIPMLEHRVYEYIKMLQGIASPTAPASFLSACNFCHHFLGMEGTLSVTQSIRISGACFNSSKRKRPLLQRRILTVDEVKSLEYSAQKSTCPYDKYALHFFLANFYTRSRYTGLCLASRIIPDFDKEDDGFVEFGTLYSKTQNTAEEITTFLPLVAPATGITGYKWGKAFMDERTKQELDKLDYVLPTPGNGGSWINEPLDVSSAGRWLRDLLQQAGHSLVERVATHSLKATPLSWASKFDSPLETRALLGYHAARELTSTLCYSRDAQSGPLRELNKIIRAIRDGSFLPDATRSGRINSPHEPGSVRTSKTSSLPSSSFAVVDPYTLANSGPDSDSDTDQASSDSDDSDSESSVDDDKLAPIIKSSEKQPLRLDDHLPYVHKSSYIVHARSPDQTKLKCGRILSITYTRKAWEEVDTYLRCAQCFR